MKICILTGIFPPDIGGPATYVQKLAQEFSARGISVKVITYSNEFFIEPEKQYKIIRISKKYPKFFRHLLFLFAVLKEGRECDLFYAQNLFSVGIPGLITSKILRKKFIVKIVGDYAWEQSLKRNWFTGGIDDFQKAKSFKINFLKRIQKMIALRADLIIVPSNYLKTIVNGWGVPEDKIEVIYNAIETGLELNISKEKAKKMVEIDGDIILSIGRLSSWKGFGFLIETMTDLLKENSNFKLVIVGEGEEKEKLEAKIKNLGLGESVKLVGKVSHQNIPFYFKAADIFVLNSEYEGLSHTILEAMQFGVPVIASNKGGNPELIEDNLNGFLIEYNNKEQIKNAILRLWRDKTLQEKFIQNSKEKLKDFSWENLVEKTLSVLSNNSQHSHT